MTSASDEIRAILAGGKKKPAAPAVESKPEAANLLTTHRSLVASIQRKLDGLAASLGEASAQAARDPKLAAEALGKGPRDALRAIKELIDSSLAHVEEVVLGAAKGQTIAESRAIKVEHALFALAEGTDTNTAQNDYAKQLAASSAEAERFIGSIKQLQIGSKVGVGRNSYAVASEPTKRGAEWFVALSGPGVGTADGYSLLVPSASPKLEGAEVVLVHDKTGAKVGLMFADVVLEAVGKEQYKGFNSVKPGDMVRISAQVFRIIGKSGNSALGQDEKIRAAYVSMPGYVNSPPGDFAGRGGKDFQDAVPSGAGRPTQPQGQGGHESLVGTAVLKYNPHTGQFSFPSGKLPGEYEMADTIQIVGHEPDMPSFYKMESRQVIGVERFELMIDEARGMSTLEKLADLVEANKGMKVNGFFVDPAMARTILAIHESLGDDNQERMAALPIHKMITVAMKMAAEAKKPTN